MTVMEHHELNCDEYDDDFARLDWELYLLFPERLDTGWYNPPEDEDTDDVDEDTFWHDLDFWDED
jgi:hypothetical protein